MAGGVPATTESNVSFHSGLSFLFVTLGGYSKVDMLGSRYQFVNFVTKKSTML